MKSYDVRMAETFDRLMAQVGHLAPATFKLEHPDPGPDDSRTFFYVIKFPYAELRIYVEDIVAVYEPWSAKLGFSLAEGETIPQDLIEFFEHGIQALDNDVGEVALTY